MVPMVIGNSLSNVPPSIEWGQLNVTYPISTHYTCFEIYNNTLFGFGSQTGDKNVYWIDVDEIINYNNNNRSDSWSNYLWTNDTSIGLDWIDGTYVGCYQSHKIDNLFYIPSPQSLGQYMLIFDMSSKTPVPAVTYNHLMDCCSNMVSPCSESHI